MGNIAGLDAKIYRDSATWGTPTWVENPDVQDVTVSQSRGEAEVVSRGATFRKIISTFIDASIEFDVLYDNTDLEFEAIRDAFNNKTLLELAVMDGDITASGAEGLRADFEVTGFTRNEPLEDVVTVSVTAKPAAKSVNEPIWFVIP